MKKQLLIVLLAVSLSSYSRAQQSQTQKCLSEHGYWTVESNVKTPKTSIIYFYNNDNVMVYKEKVDGFRLKINKTKTRMRLKGILEQSVTAWEQKHIFSENNLLVATALKNK